MSSALHNILGMSGLWGAHSSPSYWRYNDVTGNWGKSKSKKAKRKIKLAKKSKKRNRK